MTVPKRIASHRIASHRIASHRIASSISVLITCAISVSSLAAPAHAHENTNVPMALVHSMDSQLSKPPLSSQDWRDISMRAAAVGDTVSSTSALRMVRPGATLNAVSSQRSPLATESIDSRSALPLWAIKAAIKALLKHGGPALGKAVSHISRPAGQWILKNSNKLADLVDRLDSFAEAPIFAGLVQMGCEPSNARAIAQWIVTFT